MDRHAHHGHYAAVMSTTSSPENFTTVPTTIASTLLQTFLTTAATISSDRHHQSHDPSSHSVNSNFHEIGSKSNHDSHLTHVTSTDPANGHDMIMYFHSSTDATILFKDWNVTTSQGMIGSVIGIFLMAMLYEGIKFFREYMFKRHFTSLEYSSVAVLADDGKTVTEVHRIARNRMFSWPHLTQTCLHIVQMVLSYFLMLIFMTYNIWLCLGVVLGAGTGYFLFGWKKATVVDITEHCH